ncbi:MAG: DUF1080 domain-containing protein [Akkermansiaceae bacterium]|nr:DUF1080 domain-containing protein [Akkermansiaceae bacterium]MCF7730220.1 DUF1080 domain-containing protein [Akkermansiaceae bacterium]
MNRKPMLVLLAALAATHMTVAADDKDKPAAKPEADHAWQALFDGKTLKGWKEADFGTKGNITAWIDDKQVIEQELAEHRISIRMEIQPCVPLGISTWYTGSAIRNIRLRKLD